MFGGGGTPSPLASLPAMSYDAASGTTTSVLSTASTAASSSGGFFSSILPMIASILPFAEGSYAIGSDGLAYIHKNEMVIPAEDAEQLRGYMGQGAGPGGRFPAGAFSTPQIAHANGLSGTSSIGGGMSQTNHISYAPTIHAGNMTGPIDFRAELSRHSGDVETMVRKASANGSVRLPGRGR